jgi:hypothetical protein
MFVSGSRDVHHASEKLKISAAVRQFSGCCPCSNSPFLGRRLAFDDCQVPEEEGDRQ